MCKYQAPTQKKKSKVYFKQKMGGCEFDPRPICFCRYWALVYVGQLNNLLTNQSAVFVKVFSKKIRAKTFKHLDVVDNYYNNSPKKE